MPQKNFDKWTFATLGVTLLYTVLRLNWPDHWSYWGPVDAKILTLAKDLIASKTEVFMASFSSREIFSVFFLKQIIKLSDDALHLGRFFLIISFLLGLTVWYYALKKLMGSLAAFVGFFAVAVSSNLLAGIDSVSSHSFTNLFIFLFPPAILFLSPRDLPSVFVKHVHLPLIIALVAISSFNAPEIGIFYLTFTTLYLRQESGFRWKVVIASVAGTLLFLRYYHPSPLESSPSAISLREIDISYLRDWLVAFAPLTLTLAFAGLALRLLKTKKSAVWAFHTSEEARRFGISLTCAALAYDGLGRMVQNEAFVFPLHLYPAFSFLIAFFTAELVPEFECPDEKNGFGIHSRFGGHFEFGSGLKLPRKIP